MWPLILASEKEKEVSGNAVLGSEETAIGIQKFSLLHL